MSGRKRHLLVDTLGLLLQVVVHPADLQDRDGGKLVLAGLGERYPRLAHLWADGGYRGMFVSWVTGTLGWTVTIVMRKRRWLRLPEGELPPPYPVSFQVLPGGGSWSGRSGG